MRNFKSFYHLFLNRVPERLHFAAHSHHYWPDITREAQLQYWEDSCLYADEKWGYFFNEKIPAAQKLIAANLNLSHPEQIVFAPNTHEFVVRLLSCLDSSKSIKVLTTDSEFYSFNRQIDRLNENNNFQVDKIPVSNFSSFINRFTSAIKNNDYDLIFLSHVFFNSGLAIKDLHSIIQHIDTQKTLTVLDGYHGFMALPTDLSPIEDQVFYISGAYKYAQGGEGACFMHIPKGCQLRPENTGWFAQMGTLSNQKNTILYSDNGSRFAGSTMDFTALYRLISTLELFKRENISVDDIHQHVQQLQNEFLAQIPSIHHEFINLKNLILYDKNYHGHFLTFDLPDNRSTQTYAGSLKQKGVITDFRENRLRFGFALYHSKEDIHKLVSLL